MGGYFFKYAIFNKTPQSTQKNRKRWPRSNEQNKYSEPGSKEIQALD